MLELKEIEEKIRKFWEEKKIVQKLSDFESNKNKPKFYLLDGPPYVNAEPHVGHVKTRVFKDVWNKYMLMNGFFVWFQPGFDCHGLPIENMVEKQLGLKSKKEIEKFGVDKFIEECKKRAKGNEKVWMELYRKIGDWRGYFQPYLTLENYYIEAGWWSVKEMWKKGMLYVGEKPTYWCPHCETSLSGYEVTDSYSNVKDPYIYVKFPVKNREKEYLVVFTTTPWTLVSNVAIVVKGDENYIKVELNGEKLIIAEKRLKPLEELLKVKFKVVEKFLGKDLEGVEYKPVLKVSAQKKLDNNPKARKVYLSIPVLKSKSYKHGVLEKAKELKEEFFDFVNVEEGSGLVHCAPGHGPEDYYLGEHYKLPVLSPVDDEGKFTEEADFLKGIFVKEADKIIVEFLKKNGLILYDDFVVHSYPLCWRCKSPLIFRLTKQWFLSVDKIKEKMLEENEKVKWLPSFGKDRFRNWLKDAVDWCISRQRYWGIPLPIWVCENCRNLEVIGSFEELKKKSLTPLDDNIDLHKNNVDKISIRCEKCGESMNRVHDILDVWFDSGIAPWASLGYPYRNKEIFERLWKVDLVDESQDQIRGWFYSLMFAGVSIFSEAPYKAVAMNGWVLDEKGEKMSKSLGNVVWANEAIEKLGADVLRIYFCWENSPWEQQNFSFSNAEIVKRQINVLWNTLQFFEIYSGEFNFTLEPLKVEDRWILSRLNTTIKNVRNFIENFEFEKAGREIMNFAVEDLSRTYIKIVRDRVSINSPERSVPLSVIKKCLTEISKTLAPIASFISEEIYQRLEGRYERSVFEEAFPKPEEEFIDEELERKFEYAKEFIEGILAIRQSGKIKTRWPLKTAIIPIDLGEVNDVVKILTNVKEVKVGESENLSSRETKYGTVYLDLNLYEELKEEAIFRELVRAIQEERKKRKMNVWEKIELKIDADEETLKSIEKFSEEIMKEVGAESIVIGESGKIKLEVFDREILFDF
ncbi:MAG: isoleucine--tRNA ligase [Candidatus Aenigmarchaeota archaeon]|nr:isoleucine--tRNA ligase [Candidatus Aenigmarchaeota archaeon]MDW8160338.1 isoleucine--tRNA ligase [Candidatus Aenigmarchaeota archaeon]